MLACGFQKRHGLGAADRRKMIKEGVKGIATFQIVGQIFDGHARARKDRLATKDFRVADN